MKRTYHGNPSNVYQTPEIRSYLIEQVSDYIQRNNLYNATIVDVGTGSGSLAIELAHRFPQSNIIATDNKQAAIDECNKNIKKHCIHNINTMLTNYVDGLNIRPDIVIASLPYGNEKYLTPGNTVEILSQFPEGSYFHHSKDPFGCYGEMLYSIKSKGWNTTIFIETGIMPKKLIKKYLGDSVEWNYIIWTEDLYSTTQIHIASSPLVHSHYIYHAQVQREDIDGQSGETLKNFLRNLVKKIDMTILIEPRVTFSYAQARTGLVGIITSHISFHYRTVGDQTSGIPPQVQLDIYSCKEFDFEKVTEFLNEFWKAKDPEIITMDRKLYSKFKIQRH